MAWAPAVLMGDPSFFSIKGGANPHTRDRFGRKKRVDRDRAIAQWHALARLLTDLGVAVYVIPPDGEWPGLVYPANAGILLEREAEKPAHAKTFYLSNLIPTRAGEKDHYRAFLTALGFSVADVPGRFEGEADLFPAGFYYLFTSGPLREQRLVPHLGFPPWRWVYGFRSDPALRGHLTKLVSPRPVLSLTLTQPTHYHGDTVLCAFGPAGEYLLAYLPGLTGESGKRLRRAFGGRLIPLSPLDGEKFAANSFCVRMKTGEWVLILPEGVTEELLKEVERRGVRPLTVDVSEFLKKGGGAVKCMIGILGPMSDDGVSDEVRRFRSTHRYPAR